MDNYHSKELNRLASATAIREALKNNQDIKPYVPAFVYPYLKNNLHLVIIW